MDKKAVIKWAENMVHAVRTLGALWGNTPCDEIETCGTCDLFEDGVHIFSGIYYLAEVLGEEVQVRKRPGDQKIYPYEHYIIYKNVKFKEIRSTDVQEKDDPDDYRDY